MKLQSADIIRDAWFRFQLLESAESDDYALSPQRSRYGGRIQFTKMLCYSEVFRTIESCRTRGHGTEQTGRNWIRQDNPRCFTSRRGV